MEEKRCLYFRGAEKTLCDKSANEWITGLLDFPVNDFCPECLEKLVEKLGRNYIGCPYPWDCSLCRLSG